MTEATTETTTDEAVVAQVQGAQDSDLVAIVLAHPLNKKDKQRLGIAEDARCEVNTTVKVLHDHARTLISAGYAQVDPEDHEAVKRALKGDRKPVETSGSAEAPQAGEGTDSDAQPAKQQVASADPVAPVPTSGKRGAGSGS